MIQRIDIVILENCVHTGGSGSKEFHFYMDGHDIPAAAQAVLEAGHLVPDDARNLRDILKLVDWSLGNQVVTLFGKSVARVGVKEIKVF